MNKLNEKGKASVLESLGASDGKNSKERKALFAKIILNRDLGYEFINEKLKGVMR